jgi:hypothetical protein
MARLPAATANTMLAAAFPTATNLWLAMFTADPGTTGATGEMNGGGYIRQLINMAAPSGGTVISGGANPVQIFTNIPVAASGIPYFAVFTAQSGGNYEFGGTTSGLSGSIPAGATVQFAAGQVQAGVA